VLLQGTNEILLYSVSSTIQYSSIKLKVMGCSTEKVIPGDDNDDDNDDDDK